MDYLSDGEIAWIVGALQEGERNPEGAQKLLEELDRRITAGKPVPEHLADYLHRSVRRLQKGYEAVDAFGLTQPENRPPKNAERDQRIAFLVQRRLNSGKYESTEAAALAVRDHLRAQDPEFDLSPTRIRNIYRSLKNDPIVRAGSKR